MDGRLHGDAPPSLRRRLLRLVTVATLLAWGLAATLIYGQARDDVEELMDGQMAETAKVLLALAPGAPTPPSTVLAELARLRGTAGEHGEMTVEFQVQRADGQVLLSSAHPPGIPAEATPGYANIAHDGKPWRRVLLETGDGALRVQVAHPSHYRNKEALEIASHAILPLALMLPVLFILIYFSVRRGLKPLDKLAADVAMRSPENLSRLREDATPLEAKPLVKALNRLLGRVTTTLENERRFTADAAHELRTPLAALKVQAQIAMATQDPERHRHALSQVLAGTDRATRLVEQLLRLARLDPIVSLPAPQSVDLGEVVRALQEVNTDLPECQAGHLELQIAASPVMVSGDRGLLDIALRNLVDNALRYTPAGTAVTVGVFLEHGQPVLAVTDNGPGVPGDELHRLVERFYRGSEAAAEGTGLGLAIVQRIAELHGARLEVENIPGGGFAARLRWRSKPQPPAEGMLG